jgi:hypothetical protein
MDVVFFWDIAPCSSYVNRHFGGRYYLHLQGKKLAEQETSVQQVVRHFRNVGSHMEHAALYPRRWQH